MAIMIFKPYHLWPIICDPSAPEHKGVTRRLWDLKKSPRDRKSKVVAGRLYNAHTDFYGQKVFARVLVLDVRQERLCDMTEAEAKLEGGYTLAEYFTVLDLINKRPVDMDEYLFRIEFRMTESIMQNRAVAEANYWYHMAEIRKHVHGGS